MDHRQMGWARSFPHRSPPGRVFLSYLWGLAAAALTKLFLFKYQAALQLMHLAQSLPWRLILVSQDFPRPFLLNKCPIPLAAEEDLASQISPQ